MSEEDRAMGIGNMHKKFGKGHACGSGDILVDRQTDRHTYSSQYFAMAPVGEVTSGQSNLTESWKTAAHGRYSRLMLG